MKTKLLTILLVALSMFKLCGCTNADYQTYGERILINGCYYEQVRFNGCQYLSNSKGMYHIGNCDNPIHKHPLYPTTND